MISCFLCITFLPVFPEKFTKSLLQGSAPRSVEAVMQGCSFMGNLWKSCAKVIKMGNLTIKRCKIRTKWIPQKSKSFLQSDGFDIIIRVYKHLCALASPGCPTGRFKRHQMRLRKTSFCQDRKALPKPVWKAGKSKVSLRRMQGRMPSSAHGTMVSIVPYGMTCLA